MRSSPERKFNIGRSTVGPGIAELSPMVPANGFSSQFQKIHRIAVAAGEGSTQPEIIAMAPIKPKGILPRVVVGAEYCADAPKTKRVIRHSRTIPAGRGVRRNTTAICAGAMTSAALTSQRSATPTEYSTETLTRIRKTRVCSD